MTTQVNCGVNHGVTFGHSIAGNRGAGVLGRSSGSAHSVAWRCDSTDVLVDRNGKVGQAIGQPQSLITGPVLSSDGARVLVRARDKDGEMDDIWIHAVATGGRRA